MDTEVKDYMDTLNEIDRLELLSLISNLKNPDISDRQKYATLFSTAMGNANDVKTCLDFLGVDIPCEKEEFFDKFFNDDEFYNAIITSENFEEMMETLQTNAEDIYDAINVRNDLGFVESSIKRNNSIVNPFRDLNRKVAEGTFDYAFSDAEKLEEFKQNIFPNIAKALNVRKLYIGTNKKGLIFYRNNKARRSDFKLSRVNLVKFKNLFTRDKEASDDVYFNVIRDKKAERRRLQKIVGRTVARECYTDMDTRKEVAYEFESNVEKVCNLIYDISLRFVGKEKFYASSACEYFAKTNGATATKKDVGYVKAMSAMLATKYILKAIDLDKYATEGVSKAIDDRLNANIALIASKCGYNQYVITAAHEVAKKITQDFFNNKKEDLNNIAHIYTTEETSSEEVFASLDDAMFRTLYNPCVSEILGMTSKKEASAAAGVIPPLDDDADLDDADLDDTPDDDLDKGLDEDGEEKGADEDDKKDPDLDDGDSDKDDDSDAEEEDEEDKEIDKNGYIIFSKEAIDEALIRMGVKKFTPPVKEAKKEEEVKKDEPAKPLKEDTADTGKGAEEMREEGEPEVKGKTINEVMISVENVRNAFEKVAEEVITCTIADIEKNKGKRKIDSEKYDVDFKTISNKVIEDLRDAYAYSKLDAEERVEAKKDKKYAKNLYVTQIVDYADAQLQKVQSKHLEGKTEIPLKLKNEIIDNFAKNMDSTMKEIVKAQTQSLFKNFQRERKQSLEQAVFAKFKDNFIKLSISLEDSKNKQIKEALKNLQMKKIDLAYIKNSGDYIAQNNTLTNDICNKCRVLLSSIVVKENFSNPYYKDSKELEDLLDEFYFELLDYLIDIEQETQEFEIAKEKAQD